jgi:guanine deaminase
MSSVNEEEIAYVRDGAVVWDATGHFVFVGKWEDRPLRPDLVWNDHRGRLLLPGFVDVHAHLPQYPVVGRAGYELLPWLNQFVFPAEKAFCVARAREHAPRFLNELKRNGITTSVLFSSIHEDSTHQCFEHAEASGLRIVLGQMMMDRISYSDLTPTECLAAAIEGSERLCARWHGAADGRLRYAFSPRFAVACSMELMEKAAALARQSGAFIQTHLSENREELRVVAKLFPDAPDYTGIYEQAGLLGGRTLMGHAIYLNAREREVLAATETKVAHCPSSNLFLQSGVMDWKSLDEAGIKWGLGNDVAGGPELSPWEVMKAAFYSHASRAADHEHPAVPSLPRLFHAATAGGAAVLGDGGHRGRLTPGQAADCALWDTAGVLPYEESVLERPADEVLSTLVFRGSLARVNQVWVQGKGCLSQVPQNV